MSLRKDEGMFKKLLRKFQERQRIYQPDSGEVFLTDYVIGVDSNLQRRLMDVLIRGEASTALVSCASECVKKGR